MIPFAPGWYMAIEAIDNFSAVTPTPTDSRTVGCGFDVVILRDSVEVIRPDESVTVKT